VSTPRLGSSLLILLLAGSAQAAGESYCCQDLASGRRVCGDTLPEQCRGHAYRIFDRGGNLVKEVGPPLNAEQKAEAAIEAQRRKVLEEQAREQRRRDQALLDTYSRLQDIDLAQEKAENDVKLSIADAEAQIELIRKRRRAFENEAEFYKNKALPPEVDKGLRTTAHEIRLQEELRELKKKDFATIKAKYDADRKRYLELTGGRRPAAPAGNPLPPR